MKEKVATTALGELLLLIARDERIYRAMARLAETEVPFVLTGAIASLQHFLDEYGTPEAESALQARPIVQRKTPVSTTIFSGIKPIDHVQAKEAIPVPPKADAAPPVIVPPKAAELHVPPVIELPPQSPRVTVRPIETRPAPPKPSPPPASPRVATSPPPPPKIESAPVSPAAKAEPQPPPAALRVEPAKPVQVAARPAAPVEAPIPEPVAAPKAAVQKVLPQVRVPFTFEDQQSYVHGVSLIPLSDSPSQTPFIIEEQGLDQRAGIFAVDHAGMRFFLSELKPDSYNVSKNGMLLLNKQDSLRLRGVHESIVNRLRQYGSILPAEFGTAVLSREDLSRRVEFRLHALLEFVLELGRTTTWRVTASVLDERVQRLLGSEQRSASSSRQDSERGRHGTPAKRIDVKSLERLLTQEKKIAEAVLDALVPFAETHRVEHIVNLGSGRSEEWKPILTTVFMLGAGQNHRFFKAALDVESDHSMAELMVRVNGTTECFSLLM